MLSHLKAQIVRWTGLALLCAPALALAQAPPPPAAALPEARAQVTVPTGAAPAGVVSLGGISAYQGLRVAAIRLQSRAAIPDDRLRQLLRQKTGEPLDKEQVRESIEALFETGYFADVAVEAERTPQNEVTLVFRARENYFIGTTSVLGAPNPPSRDQLANATKLQLGELFTVEKLQSGIERMKRVLEDNGYYRAEITEEHVTRPDTLQIDVTYRVSPGSQARIGRLELEGSPGFSPAEVQKISGLHPGDRASAAAANKALQRLREKYQSQRRLEAQVAITDRRFHPDTNRLDYVLTLVRGPLVDVSIQGVGISGRRLKRLIPVYEENAVDDDLLNEGRRNLRDYLQTQGFFDAEVTWRQDYDSAADHRIIEYVVGPGERHKLVALDIQGNHYFDDDLLRERMQVQPSNMWLTHGRFSESMLASDVESIKNVYRSSGFLQVEVTTRVEDDYRSQVGDMRVLFQVTEGPQTRVAALHLVGNDTITEDELLGMINTVPGQPFSDFGMASDRDAILNYYFNQGFPDVRVETAARPAGENTREVIYTIIEGPRVYVNRVLLSGLHFTRGFVVAREFQLWDADPLSQFNMLATQRRLYDLGIFNEVNMAVQNPEGSADHKNLLVHFDEARRWTFDYGLGFEVQTGSASQACPDSLVPALLEQCKRQFARLFSGGQPSASPRVSLGITRINFRGRDQTIVFRGNVGRLEQRASISLEQPRWFGNESLKLTFSTFYDNSRDVQTFTAQRIEASAEVQQTLSRITTLLYRFSYRRVKAIDNTLVLSVEQIPILSEPVRVGMPSFTYIRDKRDNPIETFKGTYTTVDFGIASSVFGSEANFNRLNFQNSTYYTFGRKKWVVARSTRIGVAEPFGGPVRAPTSGERVPAFIPLPERFFAGGGNSLRGFDLNGAGPRDLTFGTPLGGGGMFINNIELRTPPLPLPLVGENVAFVFFEDAGNVFNDPGDIVRSIFRGTQPNARDCRDVTIPQPQNRCGFNYLSHAIGGGVRYKTPIGPVRIDFGYNLNPPTFPRYSISDVRTLQRFNFYFSIGQTF